MRRGIVHAVAWSLATGAAATLTWWGVHTVLSGTAYDPPRAVPVTVGDRATGAPVVSSTRRTLPSPTATRASPAPESEETARRTAPPSPSPRPEADRTETDRPGTSRPETARPAPPAPSGAVRSVATRGGRVVLELSDDAAELVSATPEPGWSMRVWTNTRWIRVDFGDGSGATVSVFCTWNGHPPRTEVVEQ
ncbi:hypothetical protein [Streptomyces nitrosporeus]|uniref:hypothetical protein n=1 Tax=Streptomyces nitrosporeus TaxID=28894 RepID=UPI00399F32BA